MEILDEEVHRNHEFGRSMNVTTIMNSWTGQPSYPIVRCARVGKGRIRLSQMPHSGHKEQELPANENATQLWWIPLAMTDARRPDFSPEGRVPRVWLTPQRPTLEIPYFLAGEDESNWILINGEMSSYVRVLYDEHNWRLIARQLMINHTVIPQVTRVQLLEDAFALATMEKLDIGIVLNLMEYLKLVKDEFVSTTITFHVAVMEGRVMNRNATLYELLKVFCRSQSFTKVNSLYDSFSWTGLHGQFNSQRWRRIISQQFGSFRRKLHAGQRHLRPPE